MTENEISYEKLYKKRAIGRTEYIKYLNGVQLTPMDSIKACCFDCMGFYSDGVADCRIRKCSLYPFMPYNKTALRRKKRIMSDAAKRKTIDNLMLIKSKNDTEKP